MILETHSAAQTEEAGEWLGRQLRSGDVIAYRGSLGMGKTCLTRGIARGMGVTDDVASPTFAIVNVYRGKLPLYHFDMYRVETMDDLYSTGFFDYLDLDGVVAIEWSENIEAALEDTFITVEIEKGEHEEDRRIHITGGRFS